MEFTIRVENLEQGSLKESISIMENLVQDFINNIHTKIRFYTQMGVLLMEFMMIPTIKTVSQGLAYIKKMQVYFVLYRDIFTLKMVRRELEGLMG